jgi:predicted ATP-binding protein involved in virulence
MKDTSTHLSEINKIAENIKHKSSSSLSEEYNLPVIIYYSTNRAVLDIPLKIRKQHSFEQIDTYENALSGTGSEFRIFFEWFRKQEDLENELRLENNPDYRDKQLEAVRQAISSLIPNFTKLRVRRSPLRMTLQKDGEELIVNQLSDGENCLLAMVGDLARRLAIANPGLKNPLYGFGVVLIDEIELHLHPKWQREIIPALTRTFPNCQFIVTTHSPQVIGEIKPQGIYILDKTDTGIIAKRPESSYGRDSNQILEDLMDVPERPQEIKQDLLQLFRLIDAGDLEAAKELRGELAEKIGENEAQFVKADILIRRKGSLRK